MTKTSFIHLRLFIFLGDVKNEYISSTCLHFTNTRFLWSVLCLACFDELNPGCSHHSVTLLIQKVKVVLGCKSSITSNCSPLKRSESSISCGTNPSFDWKDQMSNFKRIGWMECEFGLSGRINCTGKPREGECWTPCRVPSRTPWRIWYEIQEDHALMLWKAEYWGLF